MKHLKDKLRIAGDYQYITDTINTNIVAQTTAVFYMSNTRFDRLIMRELKQLTLNGEQK